MVIKENQKIIDLPISNSNQTIKQRFLQINKEINFKILKIKNNKTISLNLNVLLSVLSLVVIKSDYQKIPSLLNSIGKIILIYL